MYSGKSVPVIDSIFPLAKNDSFHNISTQKVAVSGRRTHQSDCATIRRFILRLELDGVLLLFSFVLVPAKSPCGRTLPSNFRRYYAFSNTRHMLTPFIV